MDCDSDGSVNRESVYRSGQGVLHPASGSAHVAHATEVYRPAYSIRMLTRVLHHPLCYCHRVGRLLYLQMPFYD